MYLSAIGAFAIFTTCMVSLSPLSGQVIATTIRPLKNYPCEINETQLRNSSNCVTGCISFDGAIREFPVTKRSYYDGCNWCKVAEIEYPDGTVCEEYRFCTRRGCITWPDRVTTPKKLEK